MNALRKVLCGSSGEKRGNCSGPIPNGWSSASCDAEQIAPEPAELADVVALLERGALL